MSIHQCFPPELLNPELMQSMSEAFSAQPSLQAEAFSSVFSAGGGVVMEGAALRAVALTGSGEESDSLSCNVLSGVAEAGTKLRQLPDGFEAVIKEVNEEGGSTLLTLDKAVPIRKGSLWMVSDQPATVGHQLEVSLIWLSDKPMLPGRTYRLYSVTGVVDATVTAIKYELKAGSDAHIAAKTLSKNSFGICTLSLSRDLVFDPAKDNPLTGSFLITDEHDDIVLGYGGIHFTLRRSDNITIQHVDVNKNARSILKGQKPCVIWLTGLSGAGKSTIANLLEKQLHANGHHTYLLDGDNVRHGLNKDLGFTDEDRVENIRRIAEVAKLMVDAGLIVVTAFISPFRAERDMARELFEEGEFLEIHVDTSLNVAEQRDVKGLYKKARAGELKNFTGIDSPYEAPEHPELVLNTENTSAEGAADQLFQHLQSLGKLG